jgi:hypothetical protein
MNTRIPKIVTDSHYHLWTDVLHARALAHQANNQWDRGAYVRWTVIVAWIALEIACQDALEDKSISYRFKEYLDRAINNKGLPMIDWGQGVWQKVSELQELRKNAIHRFIAERELFPDSTVADKAVAVVRDAIKDIYLHTGKVSPAWIVDDFDRGWISGDGSCFAYATVIRNGADANDSSSLKIAYIDRRGEHISDILPSNADYKIYVEEIIQNVIVPISSVRVYRGEVLIEERLLPMRGI